MATSTPGALSWCLHSTPQRRLDPGGMAGLVVTAKKSEVTCKVMLGWRRKRPPNGRPPVTRPVLTCIKQKWVISHGVTDEGPQPQRHWWGDHTPTGGGCQVTSGDDTGEESHWWVPSTGHFSVTWRERPLSRVSVRPVALRPHRGWGRPSQGASRATAWEDRALLPRRVQDGGLGAPRLCEGHRHPPVLTEPCLRGLGP